MAREEKIVVYLLRNGTSVTDAVDYSELTSYLKKLSNVKSVRNLGLNPAINIDEISAEIKEGDFDRVVLGGDSPGVFKDAFTRAMKLAGKPQRNVSLASFDDHGASISGSTERAKAVLIAAIHRVPFESITVPDESDLSTDTVIIGGGIAGIQAALEIANAGYQVYLVEKTGTIGGHMAMFDKTFPTLDCAACILTPKMVEVGQHPNIEILSYSEVQNVEGEAGRFEVTVHKKARRVNMGTCIACGICSDVCPVKVPSEFDEGVSLRKAVYIPFPQAVPNKYLIDEKNCLYVTKGKCGACAKKCPADAINLDEEDKYVKIKAGNIIVATGYKTFDAKRAKNYGYGVYPNVITSLEFERLINASGPTGGNLKLKTQDKKGNWIFSEEGRDPESVAIIHCIGSRDENYNRYCSRVCCMYSLKFAQLIKEKLPQARVSEYYIDMRAFGKGYEEFYERTKSKGINIIRGRTAKVERSGDRLKLRSEDIVNGRIDESEFDMVILSVGLEPTEDSRRLAEMLGIELSSDGWFLERNWTVATTETFTGGVYVAGVCQGPKDIPDTVAQASAAASQVLKSIMKGKVQKSIKDIPLQEIESKAKELSAAEGAIS